MAREKLCVMPPWEEVMEYWATMTPAPTFTQDAKDVRHKYFLLSEKL